MILLKGVAVGPKVNSPLDSNVSEAAREFAEKYKVGIMVFNEIADESLIIMPDGMPTGCVQEFGIRQKNPFIYLKMYNVNNCTKPLIRSIKRFFPKLDLDITDFNFKEETGDCLPANWRKK